MWRTELPWLCSPPSDFRAQLRNAAANADTQVAGLVRLASSALDTNALYSLSKAVRSLSDGQGGLLPLRISVLSNTTTKLLAPCLAATGLRYRLRVCVREGEFDQVVQQAIDETADIHAADFILVALDHRGIPGLSAELVEDEGRALDEALDYISLLRREMRRCGPAKLIFQTVPRPPAALFGSADVAVKGSRRRRIDAFNARLVAKVAEWQDLVLDTAGLAESVGVDHWFDEVQWHHAKLPFAQILIPLYADHCLRLIAAAVGRIRKCLVLDLDNTLWGGVIGDDGLDGIVIGQGSATGEAFLAIQKMALSLRQRGIILAVCSKNTEEVARAVFQKHPEMLLREEHIAVFIANWKDKASNIENIAKTLNIGLDSLVFLDDNPVERQQVRGELPMVAVPELPEDPALYPMIVAAGGYFEAISFSADDAARAELYQKNAQRTADAASYRNLDEFLVSLDMEAVLSPFDGIGRSRISQLCLRSNQFNLTTKRYSEAEIQAWETEAQAFTLQIRLKDKFGDNGMIGVVICRKSAKSWEIDTWLMSCRVLNRRVEELVLDELARAARGDGAEGLVGVYRPTDRNALVKDHYRKLGFTQDSASESEEIWVLSLGDYQMKVPPIKITRAGG